MHSLSKPGESADMVWLPEFSLHPVSCTIQSLIGNLEQRVSACVAILQPDP